MCDKVIGNIILKGKSVFYSLLNRNIRSIFFNPNFAVTVWCGGAVLLNK